MMRLLHKNARARLTRPPHAARSFFGWTWRPAPVSQQPSLALLIDADNTSYKKMDLIMSEVSRHGSAMARRCYGNFATPNAIWKEPMKTHAISPHHVYNNTPGKNTQILQ